MKAKHTKKKLTLTDVVKSAHEAGVNVRVGLSPIKIESASVKVMRSHDYCHFEVCLSSSLANTPAEVDQLRKEAARLADKAVEQYKIAKTASAVREQMENNQYALRNARETPEAERTPEQKALIKYHDDKAFASQFGYDYDDDWNQP